MDYFNNNAENPKTICLGIFTWDFSLGFLFKNSSLFQALLMV